MSFIRTPQRAGIPKMPFEVFERKARPVNNMPVIGVQTRGTMSLNAVAFTLLMSTATPADAAAAVDGASGSKPGKQTAKTPEGADALVEFLYDKEEQIVGIRLARPDSMNAYPVRKQPGAETYIVTAKAFLRYHNIEFPELRRYVPKLYGDVLGFSLKDAQYKEGV